MNTDNLHRCTKCLLPHTFPFIEFDSNGECNYCNNYTPIALKPLQKLTAIADSIRSTDGSQDCIVMFSGGRDSSYLLHYVVKELRLTPLVFTYEWGMTTPVGERNAEIMCEKLCVERIVINGNLTKKLRYAGLNVKAWLKKPVLGMIPIFTAGDKHFFTEVNRISKQRNIKTIFIGTNPFEKTYFKSGFCGVPPVFQSKRMYSISLSGKIKMVLFYLKQFICNPAYLNRSIIDSFFAFFSFYQAKQEEIDLYQYVQWNEDIINHLLFKQYGWCAATDTTTTWRIGDGTAAFYNYIYHHVVGFTENDTLRSNQIRENVISREDALKLTLTENAPRYESIRWYLERIGLDYTNTMRIIDALPKRF